jgi:rare lipoprotein A
LCTAIALSIPKEAEAATCEASYYSWELAGNPTASGELFDPLDYTAAHWTYPFGTVLYVENLWTGAGVYVRVNDRGPAAYTGRCLDLSLAAADTIGMTYSGYAPIYYEVVFWPGY